MRLQQPRYKADIAKIKSPPKCALSRGIAGYLSGNWTSVPTRHKQVSSLRLSSLTAPTVPKAKGSGGVSHSKPPMAAATFSDCGSKPYKIRRCLIKAVIMQLHRYILEYLLLLPIRLMDRPRVYQTFSVSKERIKAQH